MVVGINRLDLKIEFQRGGEEVSVYDAPAKESEHVPETVLAIQMAKIQL